MSNVNNTMRSWWLGAAFGMLVLNSCFLHAQVCGASSVVNVALGVGGGYGFEYLPDNVLGLPDTTARSTTPTIDARQILGLGLGGEITLGFDRTILDRPGPDFTVFENSFFYMLGSIERVYAEPAEVSVSIDGMNFVPFPFDSLTLMGCAGTMPTNGDSDPSNPSVSGGNSFDLADVDLDSVRFVRIRDVTSIILNNPSHPFRDPTLNGFDLDAVVAIHTSPASPSGIEHVFRSGFSLRIDGSNLRVDGDETTPVDLSLYALDGRLVWQMRTAGDRVVPLAAMVATHGMYVLAAVANGRAYTMRICR